MGYLIDTNILSELQKGNRCHASVQRWYAATDSDELFLSVLVIGEIRLGIERLRRRDAIQAERLEQKLFARCRTFRRSLAKSFFRTVVVVGHGFTEKVEPELPVRYTECTTFRQTVIGVVQLLTGFVKTEQVRKC